MDINEKKLSIVSDIVGNYDLGLLLAVKDILERKYAASINNTIPSLSMSYVNAWMR